MEEIPNANDAGENTEKVDVSEANAVGENTEKVEAPYSASDEIVPSNEEDENVTESYEEELDDVEENVTEDPNLVQGIPINDGNNLGDKLRYNSVNQLSSLVRRILF